MRILVCDSDPAVVSLIRFMLTRELLGEVVVATNGEEALGMLRKLSFDMVITEIQSDSVSRLDIISLLQKNANQKTQVLLLANSGQEVLVLNGIEAGANDFVLKPFSLKEFALRIRKLQISK